MPSSRRDPVRWARRRMDALALSVQRYPAASRVVRRARRTMIWVVRRFIPSALERRELAQARVVMAGAPPQPLIGPKVLFMTFRAWTSHVAWDTAVAQALRHRGARCEFFFCGSGLPVCEIGWAAEEDGRPCRFCAPYVEAMIDAAGFPHTQLASYLPESERVPLAERVRREVKATGAFTDEGVDLGPLVDQSLIWFFRSGILPSTPEVDRARTDFLISASMMAVATPRLLDAVEPDVVVMVNGLFFEERIVREAALARGVRVVSYEVGATPGTLFWSGDGAVPASAYDISDLWDERAGRSLTPEEDARLDDVLGARRAGSGLSRRYYRQTKPLARARPGRRLVALFTNVSWDTAVTGMSFAFDSMLAWILESIRLAAIHPEVDLVIRVHPAETRWPGLETRERVTDAIARAYPIIPGNVRVVAPEEAIDSYALMDAADAVHVFSSTVGLEAAAAGKAVCVAGKTHYRGHGFTVDIADLEQYARLFDDIAWTADDPARTALARLYAYLFLCRAMLPFPAVIEEEPSEPVFTFSTPSDLAPGQDPMIDLLCDGILEERPFQVPA